jgi:hypothetical protein
MVMTEKRSAAQDPADTLPSGLDPAADVLSGGGRGEVAACPTGLSEDPGARLPPKQSGDAPDAGDSDAEKLEVEQLEGRQEAARED